MLNSPPPKPKQHRQEEMNGTPNLSVFEGSVENVLLDGEAIKGIVTADGTEIACKGVIITTGTFLRGKCYIGQVRVVGSCSSVPCMEEEGEEEDKNRQEEPSYKTRKTLTKNPMTKTLYGTQGKPRRFGRCLNFSCWQSRSWEGAVTARDVYVRAINGRAPCSPSRDVNGTCSSPLPAPLPTSLLSPFEQHSLLLRLNPA